MRMYSTALRRLPDLTSTSFLIVAFLTGIAGALQTPTLSLFLSTEVVKSPFMVGLFYTGSAIIGIIVSQFLAARSDRSGDRKKLILLCCILGAAGCLLFAYNRNYYLLLIVGVMLTSFGSTANPQMFALAREYADKTGKEAVMFSSILRAQVSLAWVIGPPISFALALGFGFPFMYLAAMATFLVCGLIVWYTLPSMPKAVVRTTGVLDAPRRNRRDTLLLFAACTLMWTCNSMYLINMPLYIIHELHLPDKLAGVMMGTAAGLEIPTMLIAGYYAKRFGKRFLMLVALVAGLLLCGSAIPYLALGIAGTTVVECDFHRHSGRNRHALFSGFDARSSRVGHDAVYYSNAYRLDICRLCCWLNRPILGLLRRVFCFTDFAVGRCGMYVENQRGMTFYSDKK